MVCQKDSVEPVSIDVDSVDVIINLKKALWGEAADGKESKQPQKLSLPFESREKTDRRPLAARGLSHFHENFKFCGINGAAAVSVAFFKKQRNFIFSDINTIGLHYDSNFIESDCAAALLQMLLK